MAFGAFLVLLLIAVAIASWMTHANVSLPALRTEFAEQLASNNATLMQNVRQHVASQIAPTMQRLDEVEQQVGRNTSGIASNRALGQDNAVEIADLVRRVESLEKSAMRLRDSTHRNSQWREAQLTAVRSPGHTLPRAMPSAFDGYANSSVCGKMVLRSQLVAARTPRGHVALDCSDQTGFSPQTTWIQACRVVGFADGKARYGYCIKIADQHT